MSSTDPARLVMTSKGSALRWTSHEVVFYPLHTPLEGKAEHIREYASVAASIWNEALDSCRAPRLLIGPVSSANRLAQQDGANVIRLRIDDWCPSGARQRSDCYLPDRLAITHLFTQDGRLKQGDGLLSEVDLELNGVGTSLMDESNRDQLLALLVHEFGHALGLDHSCDSNDSCLERGALSSIMYPIPLQVGRPLVLKPDESSVHALCALYGSSKSAGPIAKNDLTLAGWTALAALTLAAWFFWKRRSWLRAR